MAHQQFWSISILVLIASISMVSSRPSVSIFDVSDEDDYDRDRDQSIKSIFGACDPCPAGWGVKSLCNSTQNTVCTPCPIGSWSPKRSHFRPCTPCSKCGDGLFEDVPCTSTRDTQCDSCLNVKGHFNEDYKKKCDWKHAPESMKEIGQDKDGDQSIDDRDTAPFVEVKTGRKISLKSIAEYLKNSNFMKGLEEDIEIDDPEVDDDLNRPIDSDQKVGSIVKDRKADLLDGDKLDRDQISGDQNADYAIDGDLEIDFSDQDQINGGHGRVSGIWSRVMDMRRKAKESIAKLSEQLDEKNWAKEPEVIDDDEDDDDEDEEETQGGKQQPRTPIVHIMRPFPQMVPSGPDSSVNSMSVENEWQEDPVESAEKKSLEVNYPPSYHAYPIEALMHRQRRKALVMMTLTCLMVVAAIFFVVLYVYRRRRFAKYNRVTLVNLSPEEQEIVRQSATQLSNVEKPVKRYQLSHANGYTTLVNADSVPSLAIRENPLEAYLNGEDVTMARHQGKDEVRMEKEVHKS